MSKSKISAKMLIIQLGREESHFVLMDKAPHFVHSVTLPTPAGAVEDGMIRNTDAIRDLLQGVLDNPEFKNVRNAVISLCTSQVITETVTTPILSAKKLDKLLQANMDMYFPVDMAEYHMVWELIGTRENVSGLKEQLVQLWAVPSNMLARYYTVINGCGLSVSSISYCGNSIAAAVGATFSQPSKAKAAKERKKLSLNTEISFGKKKDKAANAQEADTQEAPDQGGVAVATEEEMGTPTDLHLTVDAGLIGMTFVQNTQVVHQRFIRCGSDPSMQFDELAMMVEYFRSLDAGRGSEINGILSGELSENAHVMAELTDILDIPLSFLETSFERKWVTCVGASLNKLSFGISNLNRPTGVRVQRRLQLGQLAILGASGAALAGVVGLTLISRLTWNTTIAGLESTRQILTLQAAKVAGYADNYKNYAKIYNNYESDWNTIFANLRTYNDNLVRVLDELENILPEKTSVTQLAIGAMGLDVKFACENKEEAAYLIMALRELQYADLAGISNLTGGGKGAATTYGNGEKAPTNGGVDLSKEDRLTLEALLALDLDPFVITSSQSKLSQDDIKTMESIYGKMPSTNIAIKQTNQETGTTMTVTQVCSTLAQLESLYSSVLTENGKIVFVDRSSAINAMMTSNPFSMNRFVTVLYDNLKSNLFGNYFAMDLMQLQQSGKVDYSTPDKVKESMGYLLEILTRDETAVAETEKLVKLDPVLEQWYVYYLEKKLNVPTEDTLNADPNTVVVAPHYNMDLILEDLLADIKFSSSNTDLNSKLDALLTANTKTTLEGLSGSVDVPENPTFPTVQPSLTPTPTPPGGGFLTPPPTTSTTPKPSPTPAPTAPPLPSGITEELLHEYLIKYITTGTSTDEGMDSLLDFYVGTGMSGVSEIDSYISYFITTGKADDHSKVLVKEYLENGKLANEALNNGLTKFIKTGSTGNAVIDKQLNKYMTSKEGVTDLSKLIVEYLNNGTTGYRHLNKLMALYLKNGTTNFPQLDNMIKAYVAEIISPYTTEQLVQVILYYKQAGTCGNALVDPLLKRYFADGTLSGIESLDTALKAYTLSYGSLDDINGALGQVPVDTRIAFVVSLGYNDELRNAELERKGLSNDGKVPMLEVTE